MRLLFFFFITVKQILLSIDMSEISGSAKFKIYYQMSLHHYFSRMYMYILIQKYLLHSIHINNKLLTSISIHLLKLFVLINYYFFHYLSLEFFVEIPAKKHCRRRWKVIMSLHNWLKTGSLKRKLDEGNFQSINVDLHIPISVTLLS